MSELSAQTVALLQFLLPGFLAAWAFYGLTSHPKPAQFERVVEALIFAIPVRALVALVKVMAIWLGQWKTFGQWSADSELWASIPAATVAGIGMACLTNHDDLHKLLRRLGLSQRSVHPHWHGALAHYPTYVVLHLKDDRRLYGWPERWPSDPSKGHFYIVAPVWLTDEKPVPLSGLDGVLIDACDVKWIEFNKQPGDQNAESSSRNTNIPAEHDRKERQHQSAADLSGAASPATATA